MMLKYDELSLLTRLTTLDRPSRTAFASFCAQWIFPTFERYAASTKEPNKSQELAGVLSATWSAAGHSGSDISQMQTKAEAMAPADDGDWFLEVGYGQNAAAAVAYAVRTWLADGAEDAAWAARQVYELADYAVLQTSPEVNLNSPRINVQIMSSDIVQFALAAIERALQIVESKPTSWAELREYATVGGKAWTATLP